MRVVIPGTPTAEKESLEVIIIQVTLKIKNFPSPDVFEMPLRRWRTGKTRLLWIDDFFIFYRSQKFKKQPLSSLLNENPH